MPDVILVRPRTTYGSIYLPWNLLYLAAPLVRDGYSVSIIDQNVEPNWQERLKSELKTKTVCVGTGAFTGKMIEGALHASEIARNAGVPVVWGGVHASLLPKQTIEHPFVDYVVIGEGEATFEELVDYLSGRKKSSLVEIKGIAWKENGKIHINEPRGFLKLDELAPTPWELITPHMYLHDRGPRARRFMDFCSSRGCPFSCGFCYNVGFHKRRWRGMSAEVFFERVKEMVERFQLNGFIFMDDYFFSNMDRIVKFSELLIKHNIKIVWDVQCRLDAFDRLPDETISLFLRAGLWRFQFGVESGNPEIIKMIDKKITLDMAFRAAERIKKFQVAGGFYFMLGFPGETPEQMLDTYKVMEKLKENNPYVILMGPYLYSPYPGTPLFDKAVEAGFKPPSSLEEWADSEGWAEMFSSHLPSSTRYFMNISKKYFRAGFLYPQLTPLYKARMALFDKVPRGSFIEWQIIKIAESAMRGVVTRINIRRWAGR